MTQVAKLRNDQLSGLGVLNNADEVLWTCAVEESKSFRLQWYNDFGVVTVESQVCLLFIVNLRLIDWVSLD